MSQTRVTAYEAADKTPTVGMIRELLRDKDMQAKYLCSNLVPRMVSGQQSVGRLHDLLRGTDSLRKSQTVERERATRLAAGAQFAADLGSQCETSRKLVDDGGHGHILSTVRQHFTVIRKTNERHRSGDGLDSYVQKMAFIRVIDEVKGTRSSMASSHTDKMEIAAKLAGACKRQWDVEERKREERREKERRERMRGLRDTNFEEYVKLVKETKNDRLMQLLDQTDQFLTIMSSRVETQKRSARSNDPGIDSNRLQEDSKQASKKKSTNSAIVQSEYYDNTHLIKEKVKQPPKFQGKLMPYQLSGLEFMVSMYNNKLSGILADEMGLGKTVQTIALFDYLMEFKHNPGPHLIVVPLSTMPNWMTEIARFTPHMKALAYKGTPEERTLVARKIRKGNFNILLTTFDFITREKQIISTPKYRYIVVDEGHRMKNSKSKFHMILSEKKFACSNRLLLTGTPLQNNMDELWALLNFILPKIFTSTEEFTNWFEQPFGEGGDKGTKEAKSAMALNEDEQFLVINRLHAVLRPFLLRRVKSEVLGDLPDKVEYTIRMHLSPWQRIMYKQIKSKLNLTSGNNKTTLNNTGMQLRKIVNHPYLFVDEYAIDAAIMNVSAKFEVLDRCLTKLVATKHKTLIFSQFTQVLDIMEDFIHLKGWKHFRLDGSLNLDGRKTIIETFNDPSSDVLIFLLSTRAGGLGVNLQAADTVIIFDSDWNPHQDLQAQARAHRMGQKSEVRVFKLLTLSSIEEAVLNRTEMKLAMDNKIIQAGGFSQEGMQDTDNLESMLRAAIQQEEDQEGKGYAAIPATTPEELNRYLARSQAEERQFAEIDKQTFGIPHIRDVNKKFKEASMKSSEPGEEKNISAEDPTFIRLQAAGRICVESDVPAEFRYVEEKKEELPAVRRRRQGRSVGQLANLLDDRDFIEAEAEAEATGRPLLELLEETYNAALNKPRRSRSSKKPTSTAAKGDSDDSDSEVNKQDANYEASDESEKPNKRRYSRRNSQAGATAKAKPKTPTKRNQTQSPAGSAKSKRIRK